MGSGSSEGGGESEVDLSQVGVDVDRLWYSPCKYHINRISIATECIVPPNAGV